MELSFSLSNSMLSQSNYDQQNAKGAAMSAPFYFFFVLVAIASTVLCCNSPWTRRLLCCQEQQPEQPTSTREVAPYDVEEAKKQMEFVKSNLPYQTVEEGEEETSNNTSNGKKRSSQTLHTRRGSQQRNSTTVVQRSSVSSQESSSIVSVCSICLSGYYKGDEVASSTNPLCPHEYHRDCIQDWLIKHEQCPMCQHVFLLEPAVSASQTTLEANLDAPSETLLPAKDPDQLQQHKEEHQATVTALLVPLGTTRL